MVIVTAENKMGFLKNYRTTLIKKKNQSWISETKTIGADLLCRHCEGRRKKEQDITIKPRVRKAYLS